MDDVEVTILNRQRSHPVDARGLAGFARRLAEIVPPDEAERLGVCLVSDRRMRDYNRRYRGRRSTTDVLAFPWDGCTDEEGRAHLGDIVISVPRAALQAREAGHSLSRELRVLLLHAYLHLLGYDHEADEGAMLRLQRRLERRLLRPRRGGAR